MLMVRGAAVILLLPVVMSSACTEAGTPPPPRPVTSRVGGASTPPATVVATRVPAVRLTVPAVVPGELVREVISLRDGFPHTDTTLREMPRAGRAYAVRAACTASAPDRRLSYEVVSAKVGAPRRVIVGGDILCDGSELIDEIDQLPRMPIAVNFTGDRADITSGYALVVPAGR